MKKLISIFLSLLIILSASALFGASAKARVKNKSLSLYSGKTYILKKPANRTYKFKIKYNSKKYISVKLKNRTKTYKLTIKAKKLTSKGKKPVIKIYYLNSKKKVVPVMYLRYKVTEMKKVTFRDYKMNEKTSRKITLSNPYAYEYTLKTSQKDTIKISSKYSKKGANRAYTVKALKKGIAYIRVYFKGTKKKIGSFRIDSGDYKTFINPKYKTLTLKYNAHGSSVYMSKSHKNVKEILAFKHAGAVYSATVKNENVASIVSSRVVYATGKGTTTVKIYETRGKKKKAIGSIKVKTVKGSMAYVAAQNALFYDKMVFGNGDNTVFLDLKSEKTAALKPVIEERLLNNMLTGSEFKKSDYKLSFKSSNQKVAKVSSKGKVTAVKAGSAKISCSLEFTDKSVYNTTCVIIVEKN